MVNGGFPTIVTDLVFLAVPICATALGVWGNGVVSGEQIVGAWTLSLGYAAGRPVNGGSSSSSGGGAL